MAYTIPDIILWSKISQPLARIGEAKRLSKGDTAADVDLDVKIYNTRLDVEAEYAADPNSEDTYAMGNYLLSLIGVYLFTAQQVGGGGGSISPITPPSGSIPDELDFYVDASSPIVTGGSLILLDGSGGNPDYRGYNIQFIKGFQTLSKVNDGVSVCYSWNKSSGLMSLINGVAQLGENMQIYPML